ncbi:MAG: hypothetical protein K2G60_07090 [Oscillospiraceae bacterium]|nr:hypothetical protein [Oscillospiraceae bacterium]
MKNYDEIANSIFERRDQYIAEQRRKRKTVTRTVTAMCCVCLVALMGVGIWQSDLLKQTPTAVMDNSSMTPEQSADNQQNIPVTATSGVNNPDKDSREWALNINKITAQISGAQRYYDPALYYSEVWNTAKMAEYLGIDLSAVEGLTYSGSGEFKVTFANDGTIAADTAVYGFNGNDVLICVSKIGTPYDCLYSLESNHKTMFKLADGSLIPALIGAGADGFIYADFACNGLNYRVTATNLSDARFAEIVRNVMELSAK